MGRNKIEIKKLELAQRKITYSKRYKGLVKKAGELSILCEMPVLLVTGKTTGGYKVCIEGKRSFNAVVTQYLNEGKEKRRKSGEESIQIIRKCYKDGHVVNLRSMQLTEGEENSEKKRQLEKIKQEIAEIQNQLGSLQKIYQLGKIKSAQELNDLQISIMNLITRNKYKKALFLEQWKRSSYLHAHLIRDPRGSTSTLVAPILPTALLSTNCSASFYSRDPRGSTSTTVAQTVPTALLSTNHGASFYRRDPRCSTSTTVAPIVPAALLSTNHRAFFYNRDPRCSTSTSAAPVVTPAHFSYNHTAPSTIGSIQRHGPAIYGSSSNAAGSVQIHGHTIHGSTTLSQGPWNMNEMTNISASASSSNPRNGNLLEEAGSDQYMQYQYNEDTTFFDTLLLQNPNVEYSRLFDTEGNFELLAHHEEDL